MMNSQVPLPALISNESCSSSQEGMKPWALVVRSHLHRAPSAYWGQLSRLCWWSWHSPFPREIDRKPCYIYQANVSSGKPRVKLDRRWCVCNSDIKQPRIASFTARAASWAEPSQLHAPKKTNLISACSTAWLELHSQSTLHSNNKNWFCSLPNPDRAGKCAPLPSL